MKHSHDLKVVVVLQNCVRLIRDEPDCGSKACVTTLDDGTEEGNIEVESVDMREKNPEAKTFPPIKTEPEVRVWGLCVRQQISWFLDHLLPQKENIRKHISTILMYVPVICVVY